MQHRVLLIQPSVLSNGDVYYSSISNGLIALALYFESQNVDCRILHFCGQRSSLEDTILKALREFQPDLIGINLTWHVHSNAAMRIAYIIHSIGIDVPVVLGGLTASIFARQIFDYLKTEEIDKGKTIPIHAIIRGDAEVPLIELLQKKTVDVSNSTFIRPDGAIVTNPICYSPSSLPKVSFLRSPSETIIDWEGYLNRSSYRTSVPFHEETIGHNSAPKEFHIYVGRGCNYNCVYCGGSQNAHREITGRTTAVFRDIDDVLVDVYKVVDAGAKTIYFDFDPVHNRRFYWNLFSRMQPIPARILFSAWSGPLQEDLLERMCNIFEKVEVVISPDSGSEELRRMLFKAHKGRFFYTNDELIAFFSNLQKRNCHAMCYFIEGHPYETADTKRETQLLVDKLTRMFNNLFCKDYETDIKRNLCTTPLYIEPGSMIHNSPSEYGVQLTWMHFADFFVDYKNPSADLGIIRQ